MAALVLALACAAGVTTAGPALGRAAAPAPGSAPAPAQVRAPEAASTNPLAGHPWGVYQGPGDQVSAPYAAAVGEERTLLASIAERPRARWFGGWIPDDQIAGLVRSHIDATTGGDPDVLVQMAIFRMRPWEGEDSICDRLPTAAEQASYRTWIDAFAAEVASTRAAIIMQPDGPFALCAKNGSRLPSKMIRYATKRFSALPSTSVYIDAGASDWNKEDVRRALRILIPAGVKKARGFALNSTHYATTADEVAFGAAVVKALRTRGIRGKHFVVNTSSNGRGFDGHTYRGRSFDNARVCKTRSSRRCVTLGIPPTTDVADPAWGLPTRLRRQAARSVDAYLWFGRPWLHDQADPFDLARALQLARTTPYPGPVVVPAPS